MKPAAELAARGWPRAVSMTILTPVCKRDGLNTCGRELRAVDIGEA